MAETDLISRQAVIEINRSYHGQMPNEVNHRIWKEINDLPSAQPERKKGRWIDMDDHVMCSCCGAAHYGVDRNYCPNCGGDMRGERDE